jgi:hypothetical protein
MNWSSGPVEGRVNHIILWNQVCQVIIRRRPPRRGRGTVPGPP